MEQELIHKFYDAWGQYQLILALSSIELLTHPGEVGDKTRDLLYQADERVNNILWAWNHPKVYQQYLVEREVVNG